MSDCHCCERLHMKYFGVRKKRRSSIEIKRNIGNVFSHRLNTVAPYLTALLATPNSTVAYPIAIQVIPPFWSGHFDRCQIACNTNKRKEMKCATNGFAFYKAKLLCESYATLLIIIMIFCIVVCPSEADAD